VQPTAKYASVQEKVNAVYLIGCEHDCEQTYLISKGSNEKHREFERVLREAIENHNPDLIAEEYHPELLKSKRRQSIALEVASEMRICHRFCDLSEAEKWARGIGPDFPWSWIPSHQILFQQPNCLGLISDCEWHKHNVAHRFPIREEFWIAQLRDDVYKTVIFICGAMHVPTFKERLEGRNIKVRVIRDFVAFDPGVTNRVEFGAREDVRKNGFPPVLIGGDLECFCTTQNGQPTEEFVDLE
jgi:hypothetical protein